jgi:opacity protein-like surface antigen
VKQGAYALGAVLALALVTPARADDASPAQDHAGWQVSFTPYVWAAGVSGDIELPTGGEPLEFDRSITSDLKFAFMGALNVEHGDLVVFLSGNYLSLRSVSNDIDAPAHLDGEVQTKLLETTPLVGYKLVNAGDTSFELLGGARIVSLKNDIHLELPQGQLDTQRDRWTAAPVVASRFKTSLGGPWGLSLYGDVGGLTELDLTWQLLAAVNYRWGERWTLGAGYRYLSLRSDKPSATIDARFSGPLLGATYRF